MKLCEYAETAATQCFYSSGMYLIYMHSTNICYSEKTDLVAQVNEKGTNLLQVHCLAFASRVALNQTLPLTQ